MGTELVAAGSVGDMMVLAEMLCKSSLVPEAVRNKPQDALVILLTGRELGLGAMQSLRGINVIKGKASMSADLMIGLTKRSPECEYFRLVTSTDTEATYETKRRGEPEPTRLTYTFAMASKAGLTGNDTYKKHTAAMLRARGGAALARAVYPDLCMGLYELSEAEEIVAREPVSVTPSPKSLPPTHVLTAELNPAPPAPERFKRRPAKPVSAEAAEFVDALQPEPAPAPVATVDPDPDPETQTPEQTVGALRQEMEAYYGEAYKAEAAMKELGMFTDPKTGETREPRDWAHLLDKPRWVAKIRRLFEACRDLGVGATHE